MPFKPTLREHVNTSNSVTTTGDRTLLVGMQFLAPLPSTHKTTSFTVLRLTSTYKIVVECPIRCTKLDFALISLLLLLKQGAMLFRWMYFVFVLVTHWVLIRSTKTILFADLDTPLCKKDLAACVCISVHSFLTIIRFTDKWKLNISIKVLLPHVDPRLK